MLRIEVFRRALAAFDRVNKGMPASHMALLLAIRPGGSRYQDLLKTLNTDGPALTRCAMSLEQQELVSRQNHPSYIREKMLVLTTKGQALIEEVNQILAKD